MSRFKKTTKYAGQVADIIAKHFSDVDREIYNQAKIFTTARTILKTKVNRKYEY